MFDEPRHSEKTGLIGALRGAVERGTLRADADQDKAAQSLHALAARLTRGRRLFAAAPIGIYLWGEVGRGKTLLMDMFFAEAVTAKQRVHFNAFMADIHVRLHTARSERRRDPLAHVADRIAKDVRLLCFDEFQVNDVADAMILGRLFERLFARGVTVVATSNSAPGDLYPGGLNRALFLPFIALIDRKMEVITLEGHTDYRRQETAQDRYFTPLGATADAQMDMAWRAVTGNLPARSETIPVLGHPLTITCATKSAARLSFVALCETHLGAADYLALAERFSTLLIDRVPLLTERNRDAARRFQFLIDTLYDRKVALYLSAAAPPDALAAGGDADAFRRTASRLSEMATNAYMSGSNR